MLSLKSMAVSWALLISFITSKSTCAAVSLEQVRTLFPFTGLFESPRPSCETVAHPIAGHHGTNVPVACSMSLAAPVVTVLKMLLGSAAPCEGN